MKSRRSFLTGVSVGAVAAVSGCLGFVTGDEPMSFEATRAEPSPGALDDTGYEEQEAGWETESDSVEAMGVEREFEITYWVAAYSKEVAVQGESSEAAAFALASLPAAEVFGESRNPIADMDNREILDELQNNVDGEYADIQDLQHEDIKRVRILGESRDVEVFTGVTEVGGREIDLLIHVTKVEHDDDILIFLGAHPEALPDEELNIEDLMTATNH